MNLIFEIDEAFVLHCDTRYRVQQLCPPARFRAGGHEFSCIFIPAKFCALTPRTKPSRQSSAKDNGVTQIRECNKAGVGGKPLFSWRSKGTCRAPGLRPFGNSLEMM